MGKAAAVPMLLLLGALYLRICFAATLNTSTIDESSLLAIKKHISSDILAKNWSQQISFCNWIGVVCSRRQPRPRVISLDLSNMDIGGSVAREIGNLSFLTSLDMSNNSLSGSIPPEIGKLRRLRVLEMAHNQLNGGIPQSVGLLRRLEILNLTNNYLSGDIPTYLSTCAQLTTLDLSYNNLSGSIPPTFGNLSQLHQLFLKSNQFTGELVSTTIFNISCLVDVDLRENRLSGSIPKHICNINMKGLSLSKNQFEGEIPNTALMRCDSVERLALGYNKLEGSIPTEVWNLTKIHELVLTDNNLRGRIPPSIGNLSNLKILAIGFNSFEGRIPQEIGKLSCLIKLGLGINKLTGEVPPSIFNLSTLQRLTLSQNNLSGNIPSSIDKTLPNLEYFDLPQNRFDGKIPPSVSNLSRLVRFQLSGNSFSGDIPLNLGNLRQLKWLRLGDNQFTNNISNPEQDFLSSLTNCNYLDTLAVSGNPITGVLPKSLGSSANLSASLKRFEADSCGIISPIPNELGNLTNLFWLSLQYNDLTGLIPTALANLTNLQWLEINGNKLQGSISHVLCNLEKLYLADFSENNFSGQIPSCLRDLPFLKRFYLESNVFSSSISSAVWFNGRLQIIDLSNNFFHGSLSPDIGNMKALIVLDLSGNQLSGQIPPAISKLQNLFTLSLSNNKLDGPLTDSFSELKGLEHLDLSCNNLSGQIPKSLEALTYLSYFNVSFNELSGQIPDRGPFENFTSEFFMGNEGLCGAPRFKVHECRRSMPKPSRKTLLLECTIPVISSVLAAAFILFLIVRNHHGKSSPLSPSDIPPRLGNERISYYDILRATCNLDAKNLIGRGSFSSVYKGYFSDSMIAAVKVFNLDVQGALVSFDTECQIMGRIRHRNLVKVITSCSNPDFKALVLAFMPNGNLDKWLYSADCSLNIFQRLEIMIDVATALEYLHYGYSSPIVHCDLKPQNILLDEDMIAHVGDFGIAKLLTQEQRMLHQTRTLGTIGYMAPEYGTDGLVSTMVDVYSYGILLMEMCSKRKPTDEMFCGELSMRKWMQESFPNSVVHVFDKELLNMDDQRRRVEYESCLASIIGLALECTTDIPKERPTMKDVVTRIKKINYRASSQIESECCHI